MCGKKSAIVLHPLTKLTGLLKKQISENGFKVSISLGLVIATTLIVIVGNYWKRRKYPTKSGLVIKHFSYDKKKMNMDINSVSSFRIFRTSHRSISPSIKSTNRQTSIISSIQDSPNHCKSEQKYTTPQQLGVMGMESLACCISFWEDALSVFTGNNSNNAPNRLMPTEDSQFCKELQLLVEAAYSLQNQCQLLFLDQRSVLFCIKHDGDKMVFRERCSSVDSFISACTDVANINDFDDSNFDGYYLYQDALTYYENVGIPCRSYRTTLLNCISDKEYVCKLHCIREAFNHLFKNDNNVIWLSDCGRRILTDIFLFAEKDPKDFLLAYEDMLCWTKNDSNWTIIQDELSTRGVKEMSFYDIVLDYILMDAFEDLETPPVSVISVIQNRWLSKGFKETALTTAVWSVLRAKRSKLKYPNGFMQHFYNISEQMSPLMAWGFLGPDEEMNKICLFFKDQVIELMRDIFNFEKSRYISKDILSNDIFEHFKIRAENISKMIETKCSQ